MLGWLRTFDSRLARTVDSPEAEEFQARPGRCGSSTQLEPRSRDSGHKRRCSQFLVVVDELG